MYINVVDTESRYMYTICTLCACESRASEIWILCGATHVQYFSKDEIHLRGEFVESKRELEGWAERERRTRPKISQREKNKWMGVLFCACSLLLLLLRRRAVGYRLSASRSTHQICHHPIISAHPGPKQRTDIWCATTRDKTKANTKNTFSSKASPRVYDCRACTSPQNTHYTRTRTYTHTHTHTFGFGEWLEWCRETKLPPILFSKPIISSRASDFIRDNA